jgi:NADH-quinone oxidoreductase subunit G
MADIEIEIDGKKLSAAPNAMVIQVADAAGIYIPRFCYHKHLSIAANCRMCLVEVEKSPKTLPACATPVAPGMKVFTRSPKALAAQKSVMEFLLINHPLDCPICDQGGECELQDLSVGFGSGNSFYYEGKRSVKDQDIGPLIATDMTRCIQCTRCVRFGAEVAGMRELGATGRGEDMEIGTYVTHAMKSEVSGNVIDICPVGALTSKPFRFTARAWELDQHATISPHDCVGSNLYAHARYGTLMRMVPRENVNINETWISDRDRYSYEGLYHDRVKTPLIKKNNHWQETDWQSALEFAAHGIQAAVEKNGAAQLGALATPSSTTEEFYLLQKLLRSLGSDNIDHRLRQTDFSDQDNVGAFPGLSMSFADIEQCDAILLIGSNIQKEQPAFALRLRKAALRGAIVMVVNPCDYAFHFDVAEKLIVAPDEIAKTLAGIAKHLFPEAKDLATKHEHKLLADVEEEKDYQALAANLQKAKNAVVLLGDMTFNFADAAVVRQLGMLIAKLSGAFVGFLSEGANSAGAWLAGAVPNRGVACRALAATGLNAVAMLEEQCKAFILLNVEPDHDCANPVAAENALKQAEFVLALSVFHNPVLEKFAHVILPIAPFTETAGTFVNAAGNWQSFQGVASAFEASRPAWKVLRVLGNLLDLEGFDYTNSEAVLKDIKAAVDTMQVPSVAELKVTPKQLASAGKKLIRVGTIPLYSTDAIVRRAPALAAAQPILEGVVAAVRVHHKTGAKLKIEEGERVIVRQDDNEIQLPVIFDDRLPLRAVYIPGGISETSGLSELFGEVEIVSA